VPSQDSAGRLWLIISQRLLLLLAGLVFLAAEQQRRYRLGLLAYLHSRISRTKRAMDGVSMNAFVKSTSVAVTSYRAGQPLPVCRRSPLRVCVPRMSLRGRIARALAARVKKGLGLHAAASSGSGDPDPPVGLLLEGFVAEMSRVVAQEVSGAIGQFAASRRPPSGDGHLDNASPPPAADDSRQSGSRLSGRIGDVVASLPTEVTGAIEQMAAVADHRAAAVSSAVHAALHAVGISGDDGEDGEDNPLGTPHEPPFDPVTALILAGYAFQAYLGPARGAYWESYAAAVPGSEMSGMARQIINTRVAYPNTDVIASAATGTYMIRVEVPEADFGEKSIDKERYIVAILNGTALHEDELENAPLDFSLLRTNKAETKENDDFLSLHLYASKAAFTQGDAILATATISLQDLIERSRGSLGGAKIDMTSVVFRAATDEQVKRDFFEFNILPEGMMLPFGVRKMSAEERHGLAEKLDGSELHVQINYIPFDMPAGYAIEDEDDDDDSTPDSDSEDGSNVFDEDAALAISKQMSMGEIPLDWGKLARDLHETLQSLRKAHPDTPYLREDLSQGLFIESLDTNSQLWLWRDEESKQVVVSFRGTEQVEWQDFFTDALAFLQTWCPGDEIVLDVKSGLTMGLDIWEGLFSGSKEEEHDVCGMPCVHWGFLRAYLSVRDSLDNGLSVLTNGFEPG
jgi:hypothetical protein